jgi:hypothetical protein
MTTGILFQRVVLFSHLIFSYNELQQTPNCGMTSSRVREEPWKSRSVCTSSPTMVSPKLAVQFCNLHMLTRHRFRFKKHVLSHPTPFNACHHPQLGKPWDASKVLHLPLSRVYNTCKLSQWKNPSFCFITSWVQNPPTSSTSPCSSQASHTLSPPTPFRKGLLPPYKRICSPHLVQNGDRPEYPPCHFVWPPVPRRSWPSIILRRARIVPDGTSVEALAIINYGHDTTSHRTRVVSTAHGISTPTLEFPATTLPHLDTSFLPRLPTYLASKKTALILENSHITPLQRTGHFHLMDRDLQSNHFSPADQSDNSTTAVSSSKYTLSLTWLQLSKLNWHLPLQWSAQSTLQPINR